ncbi:MAG: diguanylate cyclase, partial [Thermoleophilia bacterium]|nr:diguanylate cyclase [Thermoleophilia bacterium]
GPPAEAAEAAERIRNEVAGSEMRVGDEMVSVTVSIGIASHRPGDAINGEAVLDRADRALYAAKRAGRNRSMALVSGATPVPAADLLKPSGTRVRRIA